MKPDTLKHQLMDFDGKKHSFRCPYFHQSIEILVDLPSGWSWSRGCRSRVFATTRATSTACWCRGGRCQLVLHLVEKGWSTPAPGKHLATITETQEVNFPPLCGRYLRLFDTVAGLRLLLYVEGAEFFQSWKTWKQCLSHGRCGDFDPGPSATVCSFTQQLTPLKNLHVEGVQIAKHQGGRRYSQGGRGFSARDGFKRLSQKSTNLVYVPELICCHLASLSLFVSFSYIITYLPLSFLLPTSISDALGSPLVCFATSLVVPRPSSVCGRAS